MKFQFMSDKFDTLAVSSLSLLLSSNTLTVIAKDLNKEVLGSEGYEVATLADLKQALEECQFLQKKVETAELWVHNNHYTLVPGMLFQPQHIDTYLNFSTPLIQAKAYCTFHESVDSNNLQVAGAIEKSLAEAFRQHFPEIKFGHGGALVLDYLFERKNDYLDQELFAVLEDGHMYLAAFSGQDLKFFNRVEISTEEELLRYIFVAFQQLGFDRNYCRVTILGDLSAVNSGKEDLEQYFKNLIITTPHTNINYLPWAESLKETNRLEAFWTK
jgi:hypothetical protein